MSTILRIFDFDKTISIEHTMHNPALYHPESNTKTRVALSRERFRDIQVAEIDSPTREVFWPRLSCVRHVALNAQAYAYHNDSTAA